MDDTYLKENLAAVKAAVKEAEKAAGREGKTTLVAAIKYAEDEEIAALLRLGVTDVGENRVQQLLAHEPILTAAGAKVHFIGSLQKNKVKYIIDKVAMIHSVDSLSLAAEINKQAEKKGLRMDVLLEINSGREEAKSGVMPEDAKALFEEVLKLPHLRVRGFMTMGPVCSDEEEYRVYFGETKRLADTLFHAFGMKEEPLLSMGMSGSFPAAVKEGADFIRVGRRLFAKPL